MKKTTWKINSVLKTVLVILSLVGVVVSFAAAFGALAFREAGIYDAQSEGEARRFLNDRIAGEYSIIAVIEGSEEDTAPTLSDTNFRYGLIKGYTLNEAKEKGMLEDPKAYFFDNFEGGIPDKQDRFVHSYTLAGGNYDYYVPCSLFEGGYFYSDTEKDEPEDRYIVVSAIAKDTYDPMNHDLYRQENDLLVYAYSYGLKDVLPTIIVLGIVLSIFCAALLMIMAGYRRNEAGEETVVLKKNDLFPLDLGTILEIALFSCFFVVGAELSVDFYHNVRVWGTQWGLLVIPLSLIIAVAVSLLIYLTSLAANIKAGGAWKRTAVYMLYKAISRGASDMKKKSLLSNSVSDLKRRIWCVFGVLTGLEALALFLITQHFYSARITILAFLLWIAEKILIGVLIYRMIWQAAELKTAGEKMASGDFSYNVDTEKMLPDLAIHGNNLNRIKDGMEQAVSERMKSERFQTELITNVSHDIKTPLTSIINYVDLLSKEELPGEKAKEYVQVLMRQSERLKKLIQDLIDASRASSGNVKLTMEEINLSVLISQMAGEYSERMEDKGIELVVTKPEGAVTVTADSRYLCRVFDNLLQNIVKYGQTGTRAYIDLDDKKVIFRNTSSERLNISSEELLRRFVQGDASRKSEGSGLGLSIAQNLMKLMDGSLELSVDGDLFKVTLSFS